jgi:hypothetical protein
LERYLLHSFFCYAIYDEVWGVKITIEEIGDGQEEELILRCREVGPELLRLIGSLKASKKRTARHKGRANPPAFSG